MHDSLWFFYLGIHYTTAEYGDGLLLSSSHCWDNPNSYWLFKAFSERKSVNTNLLERVVNTLQFAGAFRNGELCCQVPEASGLGWKPQPRTIFYTNNCVYRWNRLVLVIQVFEPSSATYVMVQEFRGWMCTSPHWNVFWVEIGKYYAGIVVCMVAFSQITNVTRSSYLFKVNYDRWHAQKEGAIDSKLSQFKRTWKHQKAAPAAPIPLQPGASPAEIGAKAKEVIRSDWFSWWSRDQWLTYAHLQIEHAVRFIIIR